MFRWPFMLIERTENERFSSTGFIRQDKNPLRLRALRDNRRMSSPAIDQFVLLSAIVDSSDDAIISKTLDGVITSWNKSAERLFGYTAEEAVGQSITMLIPPDRLDEEPEILTRLKQGERVDHFETIRKRKDGSLLHISLTISPVRDGSGNIVGASKVARDITESRKMTLELQRANAVLEQFAYSASHDLQEPLRTVKIYGQILLENLGDRLDPEARSALRFLQDGANRMETLVRDLLAYTRITKFEKPREKIDSNLVLDSALQSLGASISENNAKVECVTSLPSLRMHFAHLQQLFLNLVGNAIKYRKPGVPPVVRVSAKRVTPYWEYSIEDNGIGIDPKYAETIFVIFKRLHSAEEYPGTGLGLAICQRVVEQYDGRIWVESQPSKGSVFRFTIPD
jgi:PAS domain S-box-containing protein